MALTIAEMLVSITCLSFLALISGQVLYESFQEMIVISKRATLWNAGGTVAALMFVSGIVWAIVWLH